MQLDPKNWWEKPTLSVAEVAPLLSMSVSGIYYAVRRGDLPHLMIGERIIFPTLAILRLIGLDAERPPEGGPSQTSTSATHPSPTAKKERNTNEPYLSAS